jgi:hypothetical protein
VTEQEWLACTDPQPMLEFLRDKASDRKLRLFAVAACRHRYRDMVREFPACREACEAAERDADGLASREELSAAYRGAQGWADHFNDANFGIWGPYGEIMAVAGLVFWPAPSGPREMCDRNSPHQAALLRNIFGNPFRPVTLNPALLAWNDGTVVRLAQAIYEDRAFDRLPILGDALEEAGCDDADILAHCRGQGEHVRGCWVVDLLLGKE